MRFEFSSFIHENETGGLKTRLLFNTIFMIWYENQSTKHYYYIVLSMYMIFLKIIIFSLLFILLLLYMGGALLI